MSKDDFYLKEDDKYVIVLNNKRLFYVNVRSIKKLDDEIYFYNDFYFDKEGYILILKNMKSMKTKYNILDDQCDLKSLYSIYKTELLGSKVFTLCEGHLGYCSYLKKDLDEGGFSSITYYKNTQLVRKKYILCSESSSDSSYSSSGSRDPTRTTHVYKKDIKYIQDPEKKLYEQEDYREISYDMVRELGLYRYFKFSPIKENLTEMYYIDLDSSSVYFPKYVELNYKYHRFNIKKHFYQLLYTLYQIHKQGIMHGDLKPYNLYIDKESKKIKIGDWGLLQIDRTKDWSANKQGTIQTKSYRAPEVEFFGTYTYKADIWTLGLMMLEASQKKRLTGKQNDYSDIVEVLNSILCCNIREEMKKNEINKGAFLKFQTKYNKKGVNKELTKLIFKMMLPNEKLRIGYEEVLSSPYFKEFNFKPIQQIYFKTPYFKVEEKHITKMGKKLEINKYIMQNARCIYGNYCASKFKIKFKEESIQLACLLISCKLFSRKYRSIESMINEMEKDKELENYIDLLLDIPEIEKDILKTIDYNIIYNFNFELFDYSKDTS